MTTVPGLNPGPVELDVSRSERVAVDRSLRSSIAECPPIHPGDDENVGNGERRYENQMAATVNGVAWRKDRSTLLRPR